MGRVPRAERVIREALEPWLDSHAGQIAKNVLNDLDAAGYVVIPRTVEDRPVTDEVRAAVATEVKVLAEYLRKTIQPGLTYEQWVTDGLDWYLADGDKP